MGINHDDAELEKEDPPILFTEQCEEVATHSQTLEGFLGVDWDNLTSDICARKEAKRYHPGMSKHTNSFMRVGEHAGLKASSRT